MQKIVFRITCGLLFICSGVDAQLPRPVPVADSEIRDNGSNRMRSIELEKVKRNANRPYQSGTNEESSIKFDEVKKDFEDIQRLQMVVVRAYTHGEKIDYKKIKQASGEMTKRAIRLRDNLFSDSSKSHSVVDGNANAHPKEVKDLIVQLDNAVWIFVDSPIFKDLKTVDPVASEKTNDDLSRIISLSRLLSIKAEAMI